MLTSEPPYTVHKSQKVSFKDRCRFKITMIEERNLPIEMIESKTPFVSNVSSDNSTLFGGGANPLLTLFSYRLLTSCRHKD